MYSATLSGHLLSQRPHPDVQGAGPLFPHVYRIYIVIIYNYSTTCPRPSVQQNNRNMHFLYKFSLLDLAFL